MSILTPWIGAPDGSLMVHITRQGSPSGSEEISPPEGTISASWLWNGPRTEPSVLEEGLGWSIASTRRERPRMSERRINS
jgi:hypothetical protein